MVLRLVGLLEQVLGNITYYKAKLQIEISHRLQILLSRSNETSSSCLKNAQITKEIWRKHKRVSVSKLA